MKKILLSFMIISMMFASMTATSFAANATINVSSVTAKAGETVDIVITYDGPSTPALGFKISYPSALEMTNCNVDKVKAAGFDGTTLPSNFNNPYSPIFATNSGASIAYTGELAIVTFKLPADATGSYDIKLTDFDCYDEAFDPLDITPVDGKITIEAPAKAELVEEDEEKGKGALETKEDGKKYYTQGFMATLTLNGQTVNAVNFKLKNKDVTIDSANNDKNVEGWSVPTEGNAPIVFAINVVNVPDGETVTCDWYME